jgi:ADP-heptose:LPS heptosyltransferase
MSKFTVSILTYRAIGHARNCIRSVLQSSPTDTQLILTDNGNMAEVGYFFEEVRAANPDRVRVVHNAENLGFIDPNKKALEMTTTEYFVMLNDDAQVAPGWLESLEQPFLQFPKAALSGLSGGCQSLTHDFHGRQGGPFEYLEGSCLMCKTEIVKKHGLFAPYLKFAYGEDSELSLRMRRLGYTLHKVDMYLNHARAATSKHIPNIQQIQAYNHTILRRKYNHYLRVRKFEFPIVVRRWAARGDVVLVTAILKKLKEENPLSPIYVETAFPEVFKGNPYVEDAQQAINRSDDTLVINLDMAYENRIETHIVKAYAESAQIEIEGMVTELYPQKADDAYADRHIRKGQWCALHMGPTTWPGKNWSMSKWLELVKMIRVYYGFRILLVGHAEGPAVWCDKDLRGLTTTLQLAAILERCKCFIGLDSFPMHVAQAVGIPTIGLFGCTSPQFIMTDGSLHRGIQGDPSFPETGARHRVTGQTSIPTTGVSMESISPERVIEAMKEIVFNKADKEDEIPEEAAHV